MASHWNPRKKKNLRLKRPGNILTFIQVSLMLSEDLNYGPSVNGTIQIQWGSEYRTSSEFEWWEVVQMSNDPVFEWHLNTKQPDHLKMAGISNIRFSNDRD